MKHVRAIPITVAIERKPPEYTLWTFPPDLAVEPKPRTKPLDDAQKPIPTTPTVAAPTACTCPVKKEMDATPVAMLNCV